MDFLIVDKFIFDELTIDELTVDDFDFRRAYISQFEMLLLIMKIGWHPEVVLAEVFDLIFF